MYKAGLLPAPVILPQKNNFLGSKVQIDKDTFIEIRCGMIIMNIYIYSFKKNLFNQMHQIQKYFLRSMVQNPDHFN